MSGMLSFMFSLFANSEDSSSETVNSYDRYGSMTGSYKKNGSDINQYNRYGTFLGTYRTDSNGRISYYDRYGRKISSIK